MLSMHCVDVLILEQLVSALSVHRADVLIARADRLDVEQDTSRRIKLRVFSHLHSLSHKYHLNRKTGEVLKVRKRAGHVLAIAALCSPVLAN